MEDRVTLLIGPPGTGKTTRLLDRVNEALEAGTPPERIAYLAFTRKAAQEAVDRACERFGYSRDQFPFFRTLHSLAFRQIGLQRDEVMNTDDFKQVGDALGWATFKDTYDETVERAPLYGGLGDICLRLYGMSRARVLPLEKIWDAEEDPGIDLRNLRYFVKTLEAYKREMLKLDFTDFLDQAQGSLDVDLFILDEAQDLTAQQWAYAKRAGATAPEVWVAGDDDQAIYQWSGADISRLLALKGRRIVLPHSYRLPARIHGLAEGIASSIRYRFDKTWSPRGEGGSINHLQHWEQADLSSGSWMLLARHLYQLPQLERLARDQGVVYKIKDKESNQTPAVRAVVQYERLRRGVVVSAEEARLVAKFVPGMVVPPPGGGYGWDDLPWPFSGQPDWMDALNIGTQQREYIRGLRRRGESLTKPGRVTISTIHGVKGGEADNVLLLPDISKKTAEGMRKDPDQEHRVWYVAVSRARQSLFPVQPTTTKFFTL